MRQLNHLTSLLFLFIAAGLALSGCGPSPEQQSTMTATSMTASAAAWTQTSTPSLTFTPTATSTPTSTSTPTASFTPSITSTPTFTPTLTITPSPTFNFPTVTVNKAAAACKWGPAKAHLWAWDLWAGDTGTVHGRAPVGDWLYVWMDRVQKYCWISPYVVDVVGNPKTVVVHQVLLPITNDLYAAPTNIRTERDGDQVTVLWDEVWMTQDDDRGYFLDVWVCQDGNYVWTPTSLPTQYENEITFTDQPGCSEPSGGRIYTVEKHGYTDPADIPWSSEE
jgi:hypothetical protein